ncbi:MAG: hypothetical protein ABDH91_08870 [Bacteroidia bacterium]
MKPSRQLWAGDTTPALKLLGNLGPGTPLAAVVYAGKLYLGRKQYAPLLQIGWRLLRDTSLLARKWGVYFLGSTYAGEGQEDSLDYLWREFVLSMPKSSLHDLPIVPQKGGGTTVVILDTALRPIPVPFFPRNLGPSINTSSTEAFPSLTVDGNRLYYTSEQKGTEDIYWCERDSVTKRWKDPKPLGEPISTSNYSEGASCFSPDGQWVIFAICGRSDGLGGCDIYLSELNGQEWSPPKNLGRPVNTSHWESQVCISHDRKRIYFASDRPGGLGGTDIWYSEWKDGRWQSPVNLGPRINTSGNECYPFIAADGRTLYFASDGHPRLGGLDLFISVQTDGG